MLYLIHENPIRDTHHKLLVSNIEEMGLDYELIQFAPLDVDITFKTKRKDVWVFGTFSLVHFVNKYGFYPGSMYNSNHDFEVYAPRYGENMLNHDAVVFSFTEPLPEGKRWDMFFARPCGDTKAFTGQIFMRHSWNEYVRQQINNDKLRYIKEKPETIRVLVSPLKNIASEIRCWIVGGEVITMSQYREANALMPCNLDHDLLLKEKVQRLADIYQPVEAFVLDVCKLSDADMPGEIKIVEINCINCSGFYKADMKLLLDALERHFKI